MSHRYTHIVTVGAGPIGLLNAIALKKQNLDTPITLLEKYPDYQRNHVLSLKPESMKRYVELIGPDEELRALCKRLEKNNQIRISEIEDILKKKALSLGIKIKTNYEMVDLKEDVYKQFPDADLIIGADGTHSRVSNQVFGDNNKIKYPLDYVMQFRYEIHGSAKPMDLAHLAKVMQGYGIIAHEFVGEPNEAGITPVTFQVMISQQQFNTLFPIATSKKPLKLFADNQNQDLNQVPPELRKIIKGYLGLRLRKYTNDTQCLDLENASFSVNEAPATRAKQIFKQDNERQFLLIGDAALGLSYFLGFEAGIEATNKLIPILRIEDKALRTQALAEHQKWFDEVYAPGKVEEVIQYSKNKIRGPLRLFSIANQILGDNFFINTEEAERSLDLYRGYLAERHLNPQAKWHIYPHRLDPVSEIVAFNPDDAIKILKKIPKLFVDNFKGYKTFYHFKRDLLMPLTVLANLMLGLLELAISVPLMILGLIKDVIIPDKEKSAIEHLHGRADFSLRLINEGLARILLSVTLLLNTSVLLIRIATRAALTYLNESPLIENNPSFSKLCESAKQTHSIEEKQALAQDLHRKYQKARKNQQNTHVKDEEEHKLFELCDPHQGSSYNAYFRLFKQGQTADNSKFGEVNCPVNSSALRPISL